MLTSSLGWSFWEILIFSQYYIWCKLILFALFHKRLFRHAILPDKIKRPVMAHFHSEKIIPLHFLKSFPWSKNGQDRSFVEHIDLVSLDLSSCHLCLCLTWFIIMSCRSLSTMNFLLQVPDIIYAYSLIRKIVHCSCSVYTNFPLIILINFMRMIFVSFIFHIFYFKKPSNCSFHKMDFPLSY